MLSSSPRRTVLITGASRGLGAQIARRMAADTVELDFALVGRQTQTLQAVAQSLAGSGHNITTHACDLSRAESIASLVEELSGRHIDILVNNAGRADSAPLRSLSVENWSAMMDLNARAPMLLMRAFMPAMIERGWGRIVNIASVAGLRGAPYLAAYAASKHALLGLTKVAAEESRGTGVVCSALCPGFVDTEITRKAVARLVESKGLPEARALAMILASAGQSRLLDIDEVCSWALMLCGDDAGAHTGSALELLP